MTRAEKHLVLSFPAERKSDKVIAERCDRPEKPRDEVVSGGWSPRAGGGSRKPKQS
jgi:hypothetical protein